MTDNKEATLPTKLLLKYPEAADLLGMSEKTLRRKVLDGEIKDVPVGPGMKRFAMTELEAYVARLIEARDAA